MLAIFVCKVAVLAFAGFLSRTSANSDRRFGGGITCLSIVARAAEAHTWRGVSISASGLKAESLATESVNLRRCILSCKSRLTGLSCCGGRLMVVPKGGRRLF